MLTDIYKVRVLKNGEGNLQERCKSLESVAKRRIDNWWRFNSSKYEKKKVIRAKKQESYDKYYESVLLSTIRSLQFD